MITLESVIRNNVSLNPRPNGRGFFSVACKVCNDHARKGKRAGFKFERESVGYNCFNCGHSAGYDPHKHRASIPKDMITVLEAFNIPQVEWEQATFDAFMQDYPGDVTPSAVVETINPEPIQFPSTFYQLTDDKTNDEAQQAIRYLVDERMVDWQAHQYYLSAPSSDPVLGRWAGRLIIPVYKDDQLIFWQGRDLTNTQPRKYLSSSSSRDKVMYGFNEILAHTQEPLYVMEGFFDAHLINGVATFGNKLTPEQIRWLNRSSRDTHCGTASN